MSRARVRSVFVCRSCGAESAQWAGQCVSCGEWNTLEESAARVATPRAAGKSRATRAPGVSALGDISVEAASRMATGIAELDRVLGGGLVPGSVVLLGGDPGIGKSTLLLQALTNLADPGPALYVTAEESLEQVALRSRRLGLDAGSVRLLAETGAEATLAAAVAERPRILVIDSIQTQFSESVSSAPGSVSQVRECAARFVRFAKDTGAAVILVGHVTKEGALAGPRVLEHMVDAVLYFEGERSTSFRLIRAVKNRFGAVNEIGVFAMTERGLREVGNPSAMFLGQRATDAPGSAILATQEGTRPLLVEVQALVDSSPLANPRRLTVGVDQSRLAMLLAVLHRHAGIALFDQDVFVSVVGGVKVSEPAADLAVALAVMSSFRGRALPADTAIFGEVGLTGEIRPVQRGQDRLREAAKLGFRRVILPKANRPQRLEPGVEACTVTRLAEALERAEG